MAAEQGVAAIKRYRDELKGVAVSDIWTDIDRVGTFGADKSEKLDIKRKSHSRYWNGSLHRRHSNDGEVVLDPFCGCGTAVHAAQKLGRQWIGIDMTHLACSLIENRMRDAFPDIAFEVHGTPKDFGGARNLAERDKYQFQWWACSLVNAQPFQGKKKGAGILALMA